MGEHLMGIELVYVDEDTLDWLSIHKSPMLMHEMETNGYLGYKEFKVLADCGLTLKQFHVVLLYYFCGKKQAEIARIMRLSQQAVSQYLVWAKKKILKKLLKSS